MKGPGTVPEKMKSAVERTSNEIICYAANDMEFTPDSLKEAVSCLDKWSLVSFNTGILIPDKGNICEHFIIKRSFIPAIGGEIFDTRLTHVGVDNLLWAKASKLGEAGRCETAIVKHHHFSRGGKMDEVYEKGWKNKDQDRAKLKQLLKTV